MNKQGDVNVFPGKGRNRGQWLFKFKWRDDWKGPCRCPKEEVRSEREAERYAVAYVATLAAQGGLALERVVVAPDRGPTLRGLRDDWLKTRRSDERLAASTVADNEGHLDRHILPELGDHLLADLDPPTLRAFVRGLRHKGLAAFTVLNIAHTLSRMLDDALAEGWTKIVANPMRHPAVRREMPRARTRAGKVIVHMTRAQAEQLLTAPKVPEVWRMRYVLGFLAGLRDGEIAGLRWSDVKEGDIPLLEIRRAVVFKGEQGHASVGSLKTETAEREVPMHTLVASTLRAWKAQGWRRWVGKSPKDGDFVIPSHEGKAWRPRSAAVLREHLDEAKLPKALDGWNITFHATRRSFVTWLIATEVPEPIVQMLVGHAGSGVTGRHYTGIELAAMKRAVDRLHLDLRFGDLVEVPLAKAVGQ